MPYRTLLLVVLAAAGCNERDFGQSIGRPQASPVERFGPSALSISEVFVATAVEADRFAELHNFADQALSLDGLSLCTQQACLALSGTLQPDARATFSLAGVALQAAVGELAVLDDQATVYAYLAWGGDPAVLDSPLAAKALGTSATTPGEFVALPFPMPTGVAVANEADGRGCAYPSERTPAQLLPDLCEEQPSPLRLTELLPPPDNSGESWVEITNPTLEPVSLLGTRLCQMPSCAVFGAVEIDAGSRLVAHLGRQDPGNGDGTQVYFPNVDPVRRKGELVLLAPGPADVLAEPAAFLSFVRYGATLGELAATAAAAGVWLESSDAARAPRVAGESLSLDLSHVSQGSAWNPTAPPTPGAENQDIGAATDLWLSCSFPRPWNSADMIDVVVSSISVSDPAVIELTNRSSENAVILDPFDLFVGDVTYPLAGELAAGGSLSIELDPELDGCEEEHECWAMPSTVLGFTCVFDTSSCSAPPECGNNTIDVGEQCDGANLGDASCANLGLGTGVLACQDCLFDLAGCSGQPLVVPVTLCGNGVREGAEECDGPELDGKSCAALGYGEGELVCRRASGQLSLVEGAVLRQHLQWGAAPQSRAEQAVEAGVWPLPECTLEPLAAGDRISLISGENGWSPSDYGGGQ